MKSLVYVFLITLITVSCYTPEKRVDFELKPSGTRDMASTQEEIAPGLRAVFMHGFQTRIFVMFEFVGRKRLAGMECIATLKKDDGTLYTQEFNVRQMMLRPAFVDDEIHKSWMQDDMISFELGGQVYELYDQKSVKRVLLMLYNASENKIFE